MKCNWEKCVREATKQYVAEDGINPIDLCDKHYKKLEKALLDWNKGKNLIQTLRVMMLAGGGINKLMRG